MNWLGDSAHVFHVAKTGNDANGGLAQQYPVAFAADAKLTIASALSVASDGDTIILWPGTYTEQVDMEAVSKAIHLIGTSREKCIITQATTNKTILTYSGTVLENLRITQTGTVMVVDSSGQDDCQFINCSIVGGDGTIDGLYCPSTKRIIIRDCYIKSGFDTLYIGGEALIDNCVIISNGLSSATARGVAIMATLSDCLVVRNSVLIAQPNYEKATGKTPELYETDADLRCISGAGDVVLNNCVLIADGYKVEGAHADAYATGDSYCTYLVARLAANNCLFYARTDQNQSSKVAYGITAPNAQLINCGILTLSEGSGGSTYDLYYSSAAVAYLANTRYDPAKVHSNVTLHTGDTNLALQTTIASVTTADTVFVLTDGASDDDAYNNMIISIKDVSSGDIRSRRVTDYVQSTKTITVDADFEFTVAAGDIVRIFASSYSQTADAAAVADIADAVWDESDTDHMTIGSKGLKMHHAQKGRY